MSIEQKKVILKNKPFDGAKGQYNYGAVYPYKDSILGIMQGDVFARMEDELYTVLDESIEPAVKTGGLMWLSQGSKLEITKCTIVDRGIDTDDPGSPNYYRDTKVAMYIFDEDITPGIRTANSGNQLRDLIGEGDGFGTSPNLIALWNKGKSKENTDLGDVIVNGSWGDGGLIVRDFPKEAVADNPGFKGGEIFETSIDKWTSAVMNSRESSIYIVIRTAGDEREYAPLGHGWLGLSGGYKIDKRNRGYVKCKIKKSELKELLQWDQFKGGTYTFPFSFTGDNPGDNFGDARGHKYLNNTPQCWNVREVEIKITAPIWSPVKAENNNNSMWIDRASGSLEPITWLNPNYDIDYIACHPDFYKKPGKYFDVSPLSKLGEFRPISHISESTSGDNIDVQNYYPKIESEYGKVSAPNYVTLKFTIAENLPNFYIEERTLDPTNDLVKLGFFIDNWDWQKGEPETINELTDNFPKTASEIDYRNSLGEYAFKQIGVGDDTISHQYVSPGIKIIKAIVFTYLENHYDESAEGARDGPFKDHIQALRWKTVTMRVNITTDNSLMSDFGEVGGVGFTYMPWPNSVMVCSDGNIAISACNGSKAAGTPYRMPAAHPIISGLSDESAYVKSIKNIIRMNNFSEGEGKEKADVNKAYANSPFQEMDEYGDYIGESDIAQIRYFRTPVDMPSLLGISDAVCIYPAGCGDSGPGTAEDFHPYWDETYWVGDDLSNSFPQETSVGDIFIDDWLYLKDNCIIELNCGEVTNTSIQDSSGNVNIGILFGDYSIKKPKKDQAGKKNSYFKLPKTAKTKGAF